MNALIRLLRRGKKIIPREFISSFYSRSRDQFQRIGLWRILGFSNILSYPKNNPCSSLNKVSSLNANKMSERTIDEVTVANSEYANEDKNDSAQADSSLLENSKEDVVKKSAGCVNSNVNMLKTDESSSTDEITKVSGGDESENSVERESFKKFTRKAPRKRKGQSLHQTFKKPRIASDEVMSQTKYYFENGLRKVVPYDHRYNTFCKGRWVGKTLKEIYTSEFRLYPVEYYQKSMEEGRLLLNLNRPESLNVVAHENDLLTSLVHRHECPVSGEPLEIIADDENFFVINKPSSIPLHPAGRFRHNTVLSILAKEHNVKNIRSLHRLDRMTSGLLLFAKNKETACKVHDHIRERLVEKEYVCRVAGDFSKFKLDDVERKIKIEGEDIIVSEPLKVYDYRIGVIIVSDDEDAKEAETVFRFLSSNGITSIVSCKPKTGRTHQIRVHLQYLGYPIINDPNYNHHSWGEERFKLGPITKPMGEVMKELASMKKWSTVIESFNKTLTEENDAVNAPPDIDNSEPSMTVKPSDEIKMPKIFEDIVKEGDGIVPFRPDCEECKNPLPDPLPSELVMYLHALRYRGPDWFFETNLPVWAKPEWTEQT